jgi:DNA-binding NarL/FixJ family response regulator
VERHPTYENSIHLQLNVRALRARLMLALRRPAEAVEVTADDYDSARPDAMHGEYLATRALALAAFGRTDDALAAAMFANTLTRGVETRVITAAARAVATSHDPTARSAAAGELLALASTLDTWDGVVCAVRTAPWLLHEMKAVSSSQVRLVEALNRSRDTALAHGAGLIRRGTRGQRNGILSPREVEVVDLLRHGLKTREIAAALYISEATVKVHVQHILEKLNARTRAEAVARYADTAPVSDPS